MDLDVAGLVAREWDVVVVGTGVGGATLGYRLAQMGKRVLFCEKGLARADGTPRYVGNYAETSFPDIRAPGPMHAAFLRQGGRCWDEMIDVSGARARTYIPFIGAGAGGSSALYGMAMERFFPSDFAPRDNFPDAADCTLPERWPITYEQLSPYYREAEDLYRVRGSRDPLHGEHDPGPLMAPPPLTSGNRQLWAYLEQAGVHPYRLPMACEYVSGCEGCQGYVCPRSCKNDAGRTCLIPAIVKHGAALIDECEVERLTAPRDQVTTLECSRLGQRFSIRAKVFVLAAGALVTPLLLLRSRSERWPSGLANQSGLVGRNLMRHYVDLYVIRPRFSEPLENRQKEIAFSDFYHSNRGKLGSVQSFGRLPPAEILIASLEKDLADGGMGWIVPFLRLARPAMKPFMRAMVTKSLVLATVMEDLPYHENRVFLGEKDRPTLRYRVTRHEARRIEAMRGHMKTLLRPYRMMFVKQAENNDRIAHACGTCRFGTDPRHSVLDAENRAHGLSNLYVVDSSFFPSSAGTNPALTISANALRVADVIRRDH